MKMRLRFTAAVAVSTLCGCVGSADDGKVSVETDQAVTPREELASPCPTGGALVTAQDPTVDRNENGLVCMLSVGSHKGKNTVYIDDNINAP